MRKFMLFTFLLLVGTGTLVSCQTTTTKEGKDNSVDIVFEKWHIQFGQVQSIDVTLKGLNNSGERVEVQTKLMVNQYDEFLLPMLTKLEEKDQFKDGNTGSGIMKINKEYANGKLFIQKVGSVPTKNMEFFLEEDVVSIFMK
jgi:hypothetical protein